MISIFQILHKRTLVVSFLLATVSTSPVFAVAKNVKEDSSLIKKAQLELESQSRATSILPTPATVKSEVKPVVPLNPRNKLQFGLSLRTIEPQGSASVVGSEPANLSTAGKGIMPMIHGRWLPWKINEALVVGGHVAGGMTSQDFSVRGPMNKEFSDTKLISLNLQFMGELQFRIAPDSRWSWSLLSGFGKYYSIVSSTSALANSSQSINYIPMAGLVQGQISQNFAIFAGYEYWQSVGNSSEKLLIPPNNWTIGLMWGLN